MALFVLDLHTYGFVLDQHTYDFVLDQHTYCFVLDQHTYGFVLDQHTYGFVLDQQAIKVLSTHPFHNSSPCIHNDRGRNTHGAGSQIYILRIDNQNRYDKL